MLDKAWNVFFHSCSNKITSLFFSQVYMFFCALVVDIVVFTALVILILVGYSHGWTKIHAYQVSEITKIAGSLGPIQYEIKINNWIFVSFKCIQHE